VRVLRLCSAYAAPSASLAGPPGFDVIGGMQIHTAGLTSELDRRGVHQTVITAPIARGLRASSPLVSDRGSFEQACRSGDSGSCTGSSRSLRS
jgi:hypothetical protein